MKIISWQMFSKGKSNMKDNIKKYILDYSYLRDMRKFESKMNDGQFDSYGHQIKKHRDNDFIALLKSVNIKIS